VRIPENGESSCGVKTLITGPCRVHKGGFEIGKQSREESFIQTPNVANSWIQIDFRNYRLIPTHYSVRNRIDHDSCHLRNWVVEGSEDGTRWIELDRHENDCVLRGVGGVHTFSISHSSQFPMIRMIRLRQTGVDSSGYDHLILKSIEFFGQLILPAQ
jgi:E3 ubiquitin-protein ligase HECTD1